MEEKIVYYIQRKKIKNMYMRFVNGQLIVTAPISYKQENIEKFVNQKRKWILKQIEKYSQLKQVEECECLKYGGNQYFFGKCYKVKIIPSNQNEIFIDNEYINIKIKEKYFDDEEYLKRIYENWLKKECLIKTSEYISFYCEKMKKYKIPNPDIKIKKLKSRWGCCIPKKREVNFAMNLIKTPDECVEYVVVHELAHFKYIHHDKDFYDFVSIFIPDWKDRRNILNKKFGLIIK